MKKKERATIKIKNADIPIFSDNSDDSTDDDSGSDQTTSPHANKVFDATQLNNHSITILPTAIATDINDGATTSFFAETDEELMQLLDAKNSSLVPGGSSDMYLQNILKSQSSFNIITPVLQLLQRLFPYKPQRWLHLLMKIFSRLLKPVPPI